MIRFPSVEGETPAFENGTGGIVKITASFGVMRTGFEDFQLSFGYFFDVPFRSSKFNVGIVFYDAVSAARNVA